MKPAWYMTRWRWVNILHWPYTLFHLSFVGIGAAMTPSLNVAVLVWITLAFFFGMGISAHAWDLCKGDPLKLGFRPGSLYAIGSVSLAVAVGIGLWQILIGQIPLVLLATLPMGVLFAVGYGLEWPGLHGDWQFSAWWAVFPLLVAYFSQGITWTWALLPVIVFVFLIAHTQRVLSTRVRYIRRTMTNTTTTQLDVALGDTITSSVTLETLDTKGWLLAPDEKALAYLSFAMVFLAIAMLALTDG